MMHWGRVGDPTLHYLPGLAPDLTQAPNHWKPDIEMLKMHYEEKSLLIRDRSWGLWVSGWVLWGPFIPAPVVMTCYGGLGISYLNG